MQRGDAVAAYEALSETDRAAVAANEFLAYAPGGATFTRGTPMEVDALTLARTSGDTAWVVLRGKHPNYDGAPSELLEALSREGALSQEEQAAIRVLPLVTFEDTIVSLRGSAGWGVWLDLRQWKIALPLVRAANKCEYGADPRPCAAPARRLLSLQNLPANADTLWVRSIRDRAEETILSARAMDSLRVENVTWESYRSGEWFISGTIRNPSSVEIGTLHLKATDSEGRKEDDITVGVPARGAKRFLILSREVESPPFQVEVTSVS